MTVSSEFENKEFKKVDFEDFKNAINFEFLLEDILNSYHGTTINIHDIWRTLQKSLIKMVKDGKKLKTVGEIKMTKQR